MATLAEQFMEKQATVAQEIFAKTKREIPISARRGGAEIMAAGKPSVLKRLSNAMHNVRGAASNVDNAVGKAGFKMGEGVQHATLPAGGKVVGKASMVGKDVGQAMKDSPRATGYGALGVGALAAGAGALTLKKLLAKKSVGNRLAGAFKKNRGAVAAGAAGAAGLAGLAAFRKKDK